MFFHPHLTAELAETRAVDHHNAASRARDAADAHEPPSTASPLDAYPRQYGLPVTIERVSANGATPVPRTTRPRFRSMPRSWLRVRDD
ncbi:MAG TPA: hypothetical protein VH834_17410 [Solirubrobacteraceae bacterium]|jgi:hypothetical protein